LGHHRVAPPRAIAGIEKTTFPLIPRCVDEFRLKAPFAVISYSGARRILV